MTEFVYRASPTGRWHWTRRESWGGVTVCAGGHVVRNHWRRADPASVPADDRCQTNGCERVWRQWTTSQPVAAVPATAPVRPTDPEENR